MNISDFKRIISSFADKQTDIELIKGQLLTEIRGELIEAKVITKEGNLFVQERDVEEPAISWIRNRIASLPQLADRILDYTIADPNFINPSSKLLDELEYDPEEREQSISNTTDKIIEILDRRIPGTSSILYLTSDAGEGKTTLINTIAKIQARNFKEKKSNWLLLPIPLGGKPFLRFDDIVVASLMNNLRFRFFYYDSFIELVRCGLIIPAFDGFEEMFMQNSTGEALSATGNLLNKLNSSGTILIAARKAYFEYKSFTSQAKLFDTINSSVTFARLAIQRWNKNEFLEYARSKGIKKPEELYELILRKLVDPNHSILTRPVIVKQLLDVFQGNKDVNELINALESTISYFPPFVNAIIEREANTKWIDTSGEPIKPIMSIDQHYELLSILAEEMWLNNSETLKDSILDLLTEIYSETNKFDVQKSRQIKERIKQHALIIRADPNSPNYKFDHEEFREYFLGISIANKINSNQLSEIKNLFRRSLFPQQTNESLIHKLKSSILDIVKIKTLFDNIIRGEGQTSFVRENVGNLIVRLINNEDVNDFHISNYELSENSLKSINIKNVIFENCHIQNTSLHTATITNCVFSDCYFDRLEFNELEKIINVKFLGCEVSSIYDNIKDKGFYDPFTIKRYLTQRGFIIEDQKPVEEIEKEDDEDLELTEKALRRFMRSNNAINDNIFKLRLSNKADYFFKNILPVLLDHNILTELDYLGHGRQRRFKLGVTFTKIEEALKKSKGSYENFINQFQ